MRKKTPFYVSIFLCHDTRLNWRTPLRLKARLKKAVPDAAAEPGAGIPDLDQLVTIDKLQLLYRQSLHAVFFSIVAAVIWVSIVWPAANQHKVIWWIVAMVVVSVARAVLFFAYRHRQPIGLAVLRWQRPYVATLLASALVWGIGTAWTTPSDSLLHTCITYLFVAGLAGAALPAYGVLPKVTLAVMVALLVPTMALLLLRGEVISNLLALVGISFLISNTRAISLHDATVTQSFRLAHQLRASNLAAETLADTDDLTGIGNRRAFTTAASTLLDLATRDNRAASMLLIDIDHFKKINDAYGHQWGDTALKAVAKTLREQLRESDVCGRLGGDEFAVLLPFTNQAAAAEVAQKIINAVARVNMQVGSTAISLSISVGVAEGITSIDSMLNRADTAMYEAKRAGRGRIVVASDRVAVDE